MLRDPVMAAALRMWTRSSTPVRCVPITRMDGVSVESFAKRERLSLKIWRQDYQLMILLHKAAKRGR